MRAKTLLFAVFAGWFLGIMLIALIFGPDGPPGLAPQVARYWIFGAAIVVVVGWVAYIWDAFRNPRVPEAKRKLWVVVLFLAGPWAMPFYFWFYVRPREGRYRAA